jgi:UDP-2,4-diacetamido-2,4,6-trideoxy-beta-L-altropyranose hydrolase
VDVQGVESQLEQAVMRVLFRADAGASIGVGHVMRCLALARRLQLLGCQCTFAMARLPGNLCEEVSGNGFGCWTWEAAPVSFETGSVEYQLLDEEMTTEAYLANHASEFDWVVVDHYGLGALWEARIRERSIARRVFVIDDLADRAHVCEVLLDQNPQLENRYTGLAERHARLLIGPEYALLRTEFYDPDAVAKRQFCDNGKLRVLVTFGGADEDGVTSSAVQALVETGIALAEVVVVAGQRNRHASTLEKSCHDAGYVFISTTDRMASLMLKADICIGAGGVSMIERFALGLPAVVVPIAKNQRAGAMYAAQLGAVALVDTDSLHRVAAIGSAFAALAVNTGKLTAISHVASSLCDGLGVQRVAAVMQQAALQFRRAEPADCGALFEWRNHPAVRRHSGNATPISIEAHEHWFAMLLSDATRQLWIAQLGSHPMGVGRIDCVGEEVEKAAFISVYLVPDASARGWGRALIAGTIVQTQRRWPDLVRVDAQILPNNLASLKAFSDCGFKAGQIPDLFHLDLRNSHN